jgi:tRNA nucleotidyltransferase (CCA-adding enzyme)
LTHLILFLFKIFRFYGRISESPNNHETETLACIKKNAEGLRIISGERIWMELKKILMGKFSGELLKTMLHLGLGQYMGK